jgi:DNA modification methylase
MSNSVTYEAFYAHYEFLVREIARTTKPGRMTVVHCMDIPNAGQKSGYHDLPGRIIALHEKHGFHFFGRVVIWKEPLRVAIRTRLKHLTHKQLVKDSMQSTIAAGDFILIFKRNGENQVPVSHEFGFSSYAGATDVPQELLKYRGETYQRENKLSHWIWRRYASCVWDDIRIDRVLPYKAAREPEDEKHVHPLQLDVIDRCVQLWSNPLETVMTPFMGVGSEVYGAVFNGRRGVGVELKSSYFQQAVKNIARAKSDAASVPTSDLIGLIA